MTEVSDTNEAVVRRLTGALLEQHRARLSLSTPSLSGECRPGDAGAMREAAAKIASEIARVSANEVHSYDSYGGPSLPGRKRELIRQETADEIAAAIRAIPTDAVTHPMGGDDERVRQLIAQVQAGNFDALETAADQWAASVGVKRMSNAIASVFEKYASQDIMDRFREKVAALMHLAFVEGAAQGVMQIAAPTTPAQQPVSDGAKEEGR